jgi:hypothetical protein
MQQPSFVYSHLQMPQARLHWAMQMPFKEQQQLQSPSHSMRHRFCSVPRAMSSSQRQLILKPPVHFSNSTVHRGSTHQFAAAGEPAGKPPGCQPVVGAEIGATADEPRSNNTDDAIHRLLSKGQMIDARKFHVQETAQVSGPIGQLATTSGRPVSIARIENPLPAKAAKRMTRVVVKRGRRCRQFRFDWLWPASSTDASIAQDRAFRRRCPNILKGQERTMFSSAKGRVQPGPCHIQPISRSDIAVSRS